VELKLHDLSKREPKVPLTTDEALYEISTIKEEVNTQLLEAVKEAAMDCSVYSRKTGVRCLRFGDPTVSQFAYVPNLADEPDEPLRRRNQGELTWKGVTVMIQGVKYVARKMSSKEWRIYDYASYQDALSGSGAEPRWVGNMEEMADGERQFRPLAAVASASDAAASYKK
jgi:hypothetical protein